MIYYAIPYDLNKNIGVYYNQFMSMLPEETDFACFVDGDTLFTTPYFGKQIEEVAGMNRDCGLFYALTNRIGCPWQRGENVDQSSNDISYHREFGTQLWDKHKTETKDVAGEDMLASGFFMLVNKKLWRTVGGFKTDGMLGVDNDFYVKVKQAGHPIKLMRGVYLYHWYRGGKWEAPHLI